MDALVFYAAFAAEFVCGAVAGVALVLALLLWAQGNEAWRGLW